MGRGIQVNPQRAVPRSKCEEEQQTITINKKKLKKKSDPQIVKIVLFVSMFIISFQFALKKFSDSTIFLLNKEKINI